MVEQFQGLLAFFGVSGAPQSFGELVPWLVTILCCMALVLGLFKCIFAVVRSMNHWDR